jgi:hypothetical protein
MAPVNESSSQHPDSEYHRHLKIRLRCTILHWGRQIDFGGLSNGRSTVLREPEYSINQKVKGSARSTHENRKSPKATPRIHARCPQWAEIYSKVGRRWIGLLCCDEINVRGFANGILMVCPERGFCGLCSRYQRKF